MKQKIQLLPFLLLLANNQIQPRKMKLLKYCQPYHYHFCILLSLVMLELLPISLNAQPFNLNFENFTIKNGLSNNSVHLIFQDRKGWMWFGTYQGLNRFDGYKFTIFNHNPSDSSSLGNSMVKTIFEDKQGKMWTGTNHGLYLFNRDKDNFKQVHCIKKSFNLDTIIYAIRQDRKGFYWIGTENGLCQIDSMAHIQKTYYYKPNTPNSISSSSVKVVYIDRANKVWLGTMNGLCIIDPLSDNVTRLGNSISGLDDEICSLYCDTDGKMWVGTYKNGFYIIDPLTFKAEHLIIDPLNERSNAVRAIIKDKNKNYWIGTRGGLYIYSLEHKRFNYFQHDERESGSLVHNSVLDIYKDAKGDFWVGTRGGISYAIKEKQIFQCYKALRNDNHYMNNSEIYAFWMDPQEKLWIGTETGGVNIFDRSKGTFTYITHNNKNPNSLSSNCVKALMGDKLNNLWVGTFMGGIDIINLKSRQITHYKNKPNNSTSLSDNRVWSLYSDSKDNIWIGTEIGLDRFESKSKTFIHYKNVIRNQSVIWIKEDSSHDLWLSSNEELIIYTPSTGKSRHFAIKSRMMFEDMNGKFWLTTLDKGLAQFDKTKGIIKNYNQARGIANDQTYCIIEDNNGYFWISTINGLSRFDPQKETFKNYDELDGLQNNQFRYGACYKTPSGDLIFGGITGFNIFNPSEIKENEYEPPIVFTDFKISNRHVILSDDKKSLLKNSISETKKIVLPYNKNVITIEFAALNYAQASKNKYSYRLKGFESEWSEIGSQRSATYTNLDPGIYTFLVKGSNNDNLWNKNTYELSIEILPPYWKTFWFKGILILFITGVIYTIFKFLVNRSRLKHELAYERERTQMLYELDMMKVSFFTNVSHELRTPLTLITSPLEKILHSNMPIKEIKTYLTMVNRNAKKLERLVNQLLDFRKIETGNLKLELSRGNIILFLKDVALSFSPLAEEKRINFKFLSTEKDIFAQFDADKLEKIVNNLLSNSFKFTPNEGKISIKISFEEIINSLEEIENSCNKKIIEIVVEDTGIGIPESNLNKIFNRFFESGNPKSTTGTGIGLALTKELVQLHNGKIFAESNPNIGAKFTVKIPLSLSLNEIEEYDDKTSNVRNNRDSNLNENEKIRDKVLLIVDDNADMRFFIRSHFEKKHPILEANNGKEGLSIAFKSLPDIIISDILMPLVDGKEFVKRLKKDERTSLIPIILLTALSSNKNKIDGMTIGADDYITKPFDISLLETKVENLLMMRSMLREKYSNQMVLIPKNIIIDNPDEKFLNMVIEAIEKNITDSEFDIDQLSVEVGVSRTKLYRKMSSLTDMTVREFIKNIRLKRAAQLLAQNKINVSEVAFAVGFKDTSHFRKSFHREFGMNATEYMTQFSNQNSKNNQE